MLFTPQDRKRIKDTLIHNKKATDEEKEVMIDGILALAVHLDKMAGRHSSARRKWASKQ